MAYVKLTEVVECMLDAGTKKANLSIKDMLIRGALAGAFLGYATSLAVLVIVQTGLGIWGAIVFPVGLVMIVLLGLELATGNFAVIPIAVKDGRTRIGRLFHNWFWVLVGNLIGGVGYAFLFVLVITKLGHVDPINLDQAIKLVALAEQKTIAYAAIGFGGMATAFISAMLCNWMVALGSVIAFTSTSTGGKIAAMWLPTMTFFALGYEHAIVNMFVIPAGMMLGANITFLEWWTWNGIPVILGNILGGMVFTGLALYITTRGQR